MPSALISFEAPIILLPATVLAAANPTSVLNVDDTREVVFWITWVQGANIASFLQIVLQEIKDKGPSPIFFDSTLDNLGVVTPTANGFETSVDTAVKNFPARNGHWTYSYIVGKNVLGVRLTVVDGSGAVDATATIEATRSRKDD